MSHVFPVPPRFARFYVRELTIEEKFGIFPSPRAYIEGRAWNFSKSQSIYEDSHGLFIEKSTESFYDFKPI